MTPRQEFFCCPLDRWIDCKNGAEAYRRKGYRPKTGQIAASCAEKLLRNAEIKEAIDRGLSKQLRQVEEAAVTDAGYPLDTLSRPTLTQRNSSAILPQHFRATPNSCGISAVPSAASHGFARPCKRPGSC